MSPTLEQLRRDALAIAQAGIRACDPSALTRHALTETSVARYRCLAAGKAAVAMADGAASELRDRLRGGLIVAPTADAFGPFEAIAGGHPLPTAGSERGGRRALDIAASLEADEDLLVLLSGGASALLAVPADGVTLADKRATTTQLLRAGADIYALNTVRKHLSAIKGGQLAQRAGGRVRALVISDVVGDDLSVIASGPTVPDASTFGDARALLDRFGGARAYPSAVVSRFERGVGGAIAETPKPGDPVLARSTTSIIGSRRQAMRGAADHAEALGYRVVRLDDPVVGEARIAAAAHARAVSALTSAVARPVCVVSSGETTVTVRGRGRGGRNLEFALALCGQFFTGLTITGLTMVRPDQVRPQQVRPWSDLFVLASVGTDGIDGPTDAAGAIVDSTTPERARASGLQPGDFLDDNNAYAFFDALGDLVRTGPTGTNVGDLQVILLT